MAAIIGSERTSRWDARIILESQVGKQRDLHVKHTYGIERDVDSASFASNRIRVVSHSLRRQAVSAAGSNIIIGAVVATGLL